MTTPSVSETTVWIIIAAALLWPVVLFCIGVFVGAWLS